MAEIKSLFFLLQLLGWSTYAFAIFENWGDVRAFILFLVGLIFLILKVADKVIDFKKKRLNMMILSENISDGKKRRIQATVIPLRMKILSTKASQF